MPPSQSLRALINTFENVDSSALQKTLTPPNQRSPPSLPPRPVVVKVASDDDPFDHLMESPTSPTASSLSHLKPLMPTPSSSGASSPVILAHKPSLSELGDFEIMNHEPIQHIKPRLVGVGHSPKPPPLPPRSASTSSSGSGSRSNTLQVTHTYPPSAARHLSTSSTSSFHSVSLSSDGGTRESSLFDELEVLSLSTSTTIPSARPSWEGNEPKSSVLPTPPNLPPRPVSKIRSVSAGTVKRRPPPPPPPRAVGLGSRQVSASSSKIPTIATKVAPLPIGAFHIIPAARKRYENLFDRNLASQNSDSERNLRSSGRADRAWRGPSLDLTTTLFKTPPPPPPPPRQRLDGRIVKSIWECSKLSRPQLRRIWAQCNTSLHGSLDRESFVRGMWLIDEELRQNQLLSRYPKKFHG